MCVSGSADAVRVPGEGGHFQHRGLRPLPHAAERRPEKYLTRDGSQSQSGQGLTHNTQHTTVNSKHVHYCMVFIL